MTCIRVLKQQVAERRIWILLVAFWLLVANNIGAATKSVRSAPRGVQLDFRSRHCDMARRR